MNTQTQQRGAVLLIALIFMLLTAAIATTVIQTNVQEVRMAANDQFREEAFQQAEALVTAVGSDADNFAGADVVGHVICPTIVTGCDSDGLTVPAGVTSAPTGVTLTYQMTRMAPLVGTAQVRLGASSSSSASKFGVRYYEAMGRYDGRDQNLGWSEVHLGLMQKIGTGSSASY